MVYQIHDYGPIVFDQDWFHEANFPKNLPSFWTEMWGYVQIDGIAPVWIGEFGSKHNTTHVSNNSADGEAYKNYVELLWLEEITSYIQ